MAPTIYALSYHSNKICKQYVQNYIDYPASNLSKWKMIVFDLTYLKQLESKQSCAEVR